MGQLEAGWAALLRHRQMLEWILPGGDLGVAEGLEQVACCFAEQKETPRLVMGVPAVLESTWVHRGKRLPGPTVPCSTDEKPTASTQGLLQGVGVPFGCQYSVISSLATVGVNLYSGWFL